MCKFIFLTGESKEDVASGRTQTNDEALLDATIDVHHLAKFLGGNNVNPQNVLMSLLYAMSSTHIIDFTTNKSCSSGG